MDMYIWDKYQKGEVNDSIKYWVDVWDDLIINSNKNSYGLTFMSPHLLLLDIIDEIDLNSFKNMEVKKFYQSNLDNYCKSDPTIKAKFYSGFQLIRREMNDLNLIILRELCNQMVDQFNNGDFFRECFSQLKYILLETSTSPNDYETIRYLSEQLIIEFIIKGYELKSIKKIPISIFSTYEFYDDNHITTDYPHKVKIDDFIADNEEIDFDAYHNKIIKVIDALTIEERIDCLTSYFFKDKEVLTYIFNIEGLKGIGEWYVGEVHFYSPLEKNYIQDSIRDDVHDEFFQGDEENHFINAAVKIDVIDKDSSEIEAIEKIEKALDIIRCYYHSEITFEIVTDTYYIVNENGRRISGSHSVSKRFGWYKMLTSLSLNDINEDFFEITPHYIFLEPATQNDVERKVTQSLRWYRKAEEAPTMEDKLLAYWIVIENFMNVSEDEISQIIHARKSHQNLRLQGKSLHP